MGRNGGRNWGWNGGAAWSEADLATARRLWNVDGLSASAIGAQLGKSRNAVCGMIHRNKAEFKPRPARVVRSRAAPAPRAAPAAAPRSGRRSSWGERETQRAAEMWAAGMLQEEIADRLGRPVSAVKSLVRSQRALFPERERRRADAPAAARPAPRAAAPGHAVIEAPDSRPVTLLARREGQCCFPLWESFGPKPTADSLYCGGATDGETYCGFHAGLMYRAPTIQSGTDTDRRRRAA